MAETLRLEIITPTATVYSEDVNLVTLPVLEGQIGIYPQHVRLITQVVPGEIIVQRDAKETFFAVGGGLVEVDAHHVAIITDMSPEKSVGTVALPGGLLTPTEICFAPRPLKL